MQETITFLQGTKLFGCLDSVKLQQVRLRLQDYPTGTFIVRQGSPPLGSLFVVVQGEVVVVVEDGEGHETVICQREPGDHFGASVLLGQSRYPASVVALTDVTCITIPRGALEQWLQEDTRFAIEFSRSLTVHLNELYSVLVLEQGIDSYHADNLLFRKLLSTIMSSPVITCQGSATVTDVIRLMSDHQIGAVLVVDGGSCQGLITERDLVKRVLAQGRNPDCVTAAAVMAPEPLTAAASATVGDVFLLLARSPAKYVIVTDNGEPAGVVSINSLVRARTTGALFTAEEIEHQSSISSLAAIGQSVDQVLHALVAEKASVRQIFDIMATLHDRLTRRVIEISLEEMEQEGYGPPPKPWCWLNLGSSGRREQTLRTDQDNAIIYQEPEAGLATATVEYFLLLGNKIVEGLARCGFAPCSGGVMAKNQDWCRSLAQWQQVVSRWVKRPEPEGIRSLTILLDFRPIYGAFNLAEELRQFVFTLFNQLGACRMLAEDDLQARVPLGFWGQPLLARRGEHRGQLNLKNSVCIHLVDCIRIFCLQNAITATSTQDRLGELASKKCFPPVSVELWQTAFVTLMDLRIKENLKRVQRGDKAENFIIPRQLNRYEQALLKEAMVATARLQETTERHYGLSI